MPILTNQVALITGAATGIGEAVADLFAAEGAHVLRFDRDPCEFQGDVRNPADIAIPVRHAIETYGRLDILIDNAGIFPRRAFLDTTEAEWDQMQDVNLKSMFHTCQAVLPHMIARRRGKIV